MTGIITGRPLRNIAAALLLGAATLATATVVLNQPASAAATIKNKAIGVPLQEAQGLAKSGNFSGALAKAREASAVSGKTAGESAVINQLMAYYATQAHDYNAALTIYDNMIASGQVGKTEGTRTALALAMQAGNTNKALAYAADLGGNMTDKDRLLIAQTYYKQGNLKEAVRLALPATQGAHPDQDMLQLLAASYFKLGDEEGSFRIQELLAANYPSPAHWHDLIHSVSRQKGLSDQGGLELYRVRLLTGDVKTQDDYSEMAQIAIQMGLPKEAQDTLDKAKKANVLNGERTQRLITMTTTQVAADTKAIADLQKEADANPKDGTADVQLAQKLWSYGKYPEAEAAVRKAMKEGGMKDPDEAKLVLFHVQLSQGKKADALATLNSIPKTSKQSLVARVWAIYVRS